MSTMQRELQTRFAHIRSIEPATVIDPAERFRFDVKALAVDGIFRLGGKTYRVVEVGTYTETDEAFKATYDWTGTELKLVCLETGTSHNLEWEEDDDVEVSLTLSELRFSALAYDDGEPIAQDSDDLDEIVEEEWEVVANGKTYFYADDYAARYHRGRDGRTENVFLYEFEADDGEQLTVEVWVAKNGKEDFQVFLSESVSPGEIEIIALPAAGG